MEAPSPLLGDPRWRLRNLYAIKTEDEGQRLPFRPRPEQCEVIDSLIERPEAW